MRAALVIFAVGLSGCFAMKGPAESACTSDAQCESGQICFAEGCGDPGTGIVVEVTGGTLSSYGARDFAIADGTLTRAQNFELGEALAVSGTFLRERTADPNPLYRTAYTLPVSVRAVGQSLLLPGITRTTQTRIAAPEGGFYEVKLPSGAFVLTAFADDVTVPPVTSEQLIEPASPATSYNFVFAGADSAPALTGQLIKTTDSSLVPPEPVLLSADYVNGTAPTVELQLLDAATNQPVSQRFPVSSSTGEFSIIVSPQARSKSLLLVAAPSDPGAPVPTKRFALPSPLPQAISLEYGDFGQPGELSGVLLDSAGAPIAEAQVLLEGPVEGGGTFRSRLVNTGADGSFKVTAIPSQVGEHFTLYMVPPRTSRAAATNLAVTAAWVDGNFTLTPSTVTLADRPRVSGRVLEPDGVTGAANVSIHAIAQDATGGSWLPLDEVDGVTAADGTFELPMDPGVWRFEFLPGIETPLSSRLVTIPAEGAGQPVPLADVVLSRGRTVSGVVTATVTAAKPTEASYAQLRFFRVQNFAGVPASILLGTATADAHGNYQVLLPTAK